MTKPFLTTSGMLARRAEVSVPTINRYADLGLLAFIRASDGTRLFADGQEDRVRQILRGRQWNRGQRAEATRDPTDAA